MPKTYILYHGNCYDGFGAAYAAWQKFGDNATYLECHYGKPLPEVEDGSDVFMIDFSSDRETILKLKERTNLIILDHHKTAEANLKGLEYAHFDMTKSGAVLSWEYFHPNTLLPGILAYVQDRDLWKNELPDTEEVHACLASYPKTFKAWRAFENKTWDSILTEGTALLRYRDETVKMICEKAYSTTLAGYGIIMVNSTSHWSEVGNYLCKKFPEVKFTASWYEDSNGKNWSLRSIGDFDVSEIAKKFGGGGHRNAAGFRSTICFPEE